MNAVVEMDVYSGRPNPSWSLDAPDTESILLLLRAAVAASPVHSLAEPPLGYRGFIVFHDSATYRVGRGHVEFAGSTYRDVDRAAEKRLIHGMPPELRSNFESILPAL